MNYLIWSSIDLENGLGGVEVHARSLAHEFRKKGIQVVFSQDPRAPWLKNWDVIHTHGSALYGFKALFKRSDLPVSTIWVHTLHGWTHERIAACNEYFWPGAYPAMFNEYIGCRNADHVFAVHENLSFLHKLKDYSVCSNGWDSWNMIRNQNIRPVDVSDRWLFVGRGSDPVKGVSKLIPLTHELNLAAIPGEGFENAPDVRTLGAFNPSEVRAAMLKSKGLVLTSLYEGLPLVVLEALGIGVPVITTKVGGLKTLSDKLQGLFFCKDDLSDLVELSKAAGNLPSSLESRAENNQKYLKKWSDVGEHILNIVDQHRIKKGFVNVH